MAHWYENSNPDNDMMLAISDSSYINDQLNLKWLYHFNKHTIEFMIDVVENLDLCHLIFVILLLSKIKNWLRNYEEIDIIINVKFLHSCQLIHHFSNLNLKNMNEWQFNLHIHLYIIVIEFKNIKISVVIIIHVIFIKIEAAEFNMSIL